MVFCPSGHGSNIYLLKREEEKKTGKEKTTKTRSSDIPPSFLAHTKYRAPEPCLGTWQGVHFTASGYGHE